MERTISRNPSRLEARLHCLDMAVRSAQLLGRADNTMGLAEQYFAWCMKPPPVEPAELDDLKPIGGAEANKEPAAGGNASGAVPPSLRQQGATASGSN